MMSIVQGVIICLLLAVIGLEGYFLWWVRKEYGELAQRYNQVVTRLNNEVETNKAVGRGHAQIYTCIPN